MKMNCTPWGWSRVGLVVVAAGILGGSSLAVAKDKNEAAKRYAIDTSGTTVDVKPGKDGVFRLQIKPVEGFKVSHEGPLKIALSSNELVLKKTVLSRDDLADKKDKAPRFEVAFTGEKLGAATLTADATFVVCSETICEKKTDRVTVAVHIKP